MNNFTFHHKVLANENRLKAIVGTGRALFIDRDGTLIINRDYLDDPDGVELLPGTIEGLLRFQQSGYALIMISNQSGIGRGYFDLAAAQDVNARLQSLLKEGGAPLDALAFCPHAPSEMCPCRKPKSLMIDELAQLLSVNHATSLMIGDSHVDTGAGRAAGIQTIFLGSEDNCPEDADSTVSSLPEAADILELL